MTAFIQQYKIYIQASRERITWEEVPSLPTLKFQRWSVEPFECTPNQPIKKWKPLKGEWDHKKITTFLS